MTWVIVGLGNPGEEYENTRHNAGRMAVRHFASKHDASEWKVDAKANAEVAKCVVERALSILVLPDTYMNKSGSAVTKFVKNVPQAKKLIVVYDDLDLPIGVAKMAFDRGSGGHKGLESIMRAVKTKLFWRIRVGVSPVSRGKAKKPQGEDAVHDFILGRFKKEEQDALKSVFKRTTAALETSLTGTPVHAMNALNSAR